METITITSNGIRCGAINAGDELDIVVSDDVVLSEFAALRIVMLGPIRGGAGASIIAVSGPIGAERNGVLVTATTQARDLMRPLLPTDVVPARIECVDASSGRYVAGVTTQLRNSVLLWASDALPAQSFAAGNTLADIAATLAAHINARNNPHAVTASQVGADPAGTAASAVNAHNTSETAHADIRAEKLDKENETTSLSLRQDDVGFIVADTAGAYHATFIPTGITHNVPDSVNHTLSFPSKDGVLALTSDISDHTTNTDNPHSVKEVQVASASKTDADKAFGRLAEANVWTGSQTVKNDINADGTITAKTGMKVTKTDGATTKDVMSVDSTGLTVDGKTKSTSVVSNSVSTNNLRVYTTGTDASKQYIEMYSSIIKGVHSAGLTLMGNDVSTAHRIDIGSQNYPIRLQKGDTRLLDISTSGATLSVPLTARMGATILNGITTDRAIDFTEVSTDLLNEFGIRTFGKPSYIMNVGQCDGQTITFNAPYIYNQGQLDLPSVSRSSVYMFYNETSNDIVISFELTEMADDASDGAVFLYNEKANFFQRTIRQGCFAAVRVSIMNTATTISGKRAYLVCAEDMGNFQDLP